MSNATIVVGRTQSNPRIALNYWMSLIQIGLRSPAYLAFTIGMPLVYYLIFQTTHSQSQVDGVTYTAVNMVNMASFGAINAALSGGTQIEMELTSGWFRQIRLTPLSTTGFTATRALAALTFVFPAILVLYVFGASSGVVIESPLRWIASGASILLGSIPFILLGLAIGLLLKHDATMPAAVATMTLMALFGGLWLPISILPQPIPTLAPFLPSYWMALYARWTLVGAPLNPMGFIILGLWIIGAGAVSTVILGRVLSARR